MIQFSAVKKQIGTFKLGTASFQIPTGYICGLVGLNGAGKTTLLHLLMGLYKPDEGQIYIDDMSYEDNERKLLDSIGYVLVEDMFDTASSLIKNADRLGKFYSKYDRQVLRKYFEEFGLDEKTKFGKLSKGQKLKCQLAFALSYDPGLLILDEPTGNFDPTFRKKFFDLLKDYMRDGNKSVILASHLTEDLDMLADYLIYIEDGNIRVADDIESFRDKYRVVYGETYKIKLIQKDFIIKMEEGEYGTRALIKHDRCIKYDESLKVTYPTIEEFMFFYNKRKSCVKFSMKT